MMRETKVGIVVGASFLSLVGGVVVVKHLESPPKTVEVAQAKPDTDPKDSHANQDQPPPATALPKDPGTTSSTLPVLPKPLDQQVTPFSPPSDDPPTDAAASLPQLKPVPAPAKDSIVPLSSSAPPPVGMMPAPDGLPLPGSSSNANSTDFDKFNNYFGETKKARGLIGSGLLTKATTLWNATQTVRSKSPGIDTNLRLVSDPAPITPTTPTPKANEPPPLGVVSLPTPPAGGVSLPTPPPAAVSLPTPPPKPIDPAPIVGTGLPALPMPDAPPKPPGGVVITMPEPPKPTSTPIPPAGVPPLSPVGDPAKDSAKADSPPPLPGLPGIPKLSDPSPSPMVPKPIDTPPAIPKLADPNDPPSMHHKKDENKQDPKTEPKPIPIDMKLDPLPMPPLPMDTKPTPPIPIDIKPEPKSQSGLEPVNGPKLGQPVVPMTDPSLEPAARFDPSRVQTPGPKEDADSYDEEWYHCKDGDTLASISQGAYYTDKYEHALRLYNLDRQGTENLRKDRPIMRANDVIRIPPARVLERKYGSSIPLNGGKVPAGNLGGLPSGFAPLPANPATPPLATISGVMPDRTDGGNGPVEYEVTKPGMTLRDIAKEKLGNSDQWERIFRLNRWLNADEAVPVGAKIYVPRTK